MIRVGLDMVALGLYETIEVTLFDDVKYEKIAISYSSRSRSLLSPFPSAYIPILSLYKYIGIDTRTKDENRN